MGRKEQYGTAASSAHGLELVPSLCHARSVAKTWRSVSVKLLGGRGEEFWPWPGRVLVVGPSHTFLDLADAINVAFARWDRAHLSVFTLPDGRVVTDGESGAEFAGSAAGPIQAPLDIETTTVAESVVEGAEFRYVFDLGDDWTHQCVVEERLDPLERLGFTPEEPVPVWGWGAIPDQYGRRWPDDDGSGRAPRRPAASHPMLTGAWPAAGQVLDPDLAEVRAAIAQSDADAFLAAITGREIDDVLQRVGHGLPMALEQRRDRAESVTLSVINRLSFRDWPGDSELADDLLARLRGEPLPGRVVPVDLEMLSMVLEGDPDLSTGGYVDLQTGEVVDEGLTDPMMVGDDAVVDVEEDPDRWLWVSRAGSREGWRDMEIFGERQRDAALRDRLERAIEGKGAFRRFRDQVDRDGLVDQWRAFSDDRQLGRAREFLAGEGIRVG